MTYLKMLIFVYISLTLLCVSWAVRVAEVTPKIVGTGGGMPITIRGFNFADEFTYGTTNTGNEVKLLSGTGTSAVGCNIIAQETTTKKIVCYPQKRALMEDTRYCVRVRSNGNVLARRQLCRNRPNGEKCCFTAKWIFTPTIDKIEPRSLTPSPDAKLEICGRIFTSRYGDDKETAENGRTEMIKRVYSPGECELKDPNDDSEDSYYGLYVEEDSDEGCMICKPKSTFVGKANITYFVDQAKGRSVAKTDLLQVSWDDVLYMVEYYPVITSISMNKGSLLGGAVLRVNSPNAECGGELGSTYKRAKIFIGETECQITECLKNSHFDCVVAPEQPLDDRPDIYPGSRGFYAEIFEDFFESLDDIKNAPPSLNKKHFDETKIHDLDVINKPSRITGLFYARESGVYQFEVKSKYHARLYFEETPQGESMGGWSTGDNWELVENELYKITVVTMGPGSNPSATDKTDPGIEVRAKYYDEEKYTYLSTELSIPETTVLRLTSTQTQDIQVINFMPGQLQAPVYEVQKLCRAHSSSPSEKVRIGMFGCYTDEVYLAVVGEVQNALNDLAVLEPDESIIVEEDPVNKLCIRVTIQSSRGNFPDFDVTSETVTVSELTSGVPNNDIVSLMIGNRPSTPVSLNALASLNDTEAELKEIQGMVNSLFVTRCPEIFYKSSHYFENFEVQLDNYYNAGKIMSNMEGFCGGHIIRNPRRILPNNNKHKGPWDVKPYSSYHVCFAYSGTSNPRFIFAYEDEVGYRWWRSKNVRSFQANVEGNFWEYTCVSLKDDIGDGKLVYAEIRSDTEDEFFVDAISVGPIAVFSDPPPDSAGYHISEMRLRPASPSPRDDDLMDHVDVSYEEGTGYKITLFPRDCRHNFELFGLMNSEVMTDEADADLRETQLRGGGSGLSTRRIGWANPPLSGTVELEFQRIKTRKIIRQMNRKNRRIRRRPLTPRRLRRKARREARLARYRQQIDINWEPLRIRHALRNIPGVGNIRVTLSAGSTCANKDIEYTYLTYPGRQNIVKVINSNLFPTPTATAEVIRRVEGHLRMEPIHGDLFYEANDDPQVQLTVNGSPARCQGDCHFLWSEDVTPRIESIEPNTGLPGSTVRILGDMFSGVPGENRVHIGPYPCSVIESSVTELSCIVGADPDPVRRKRNTATAGAGTDLPVSVNVMSLGLAAGSVTYSFTWNVNDIQPKSGSFGGGLELQVLGSGFAEKSEVYVDNQLCPVTAVTESAITCMVPSSSVHFTHGDRSVDVYVKVETVNEPMTRYATSQFNYSVDQTGIIMEADYPSLLSIHGFDVVTFTGNQFGAKRALKIQGASLNPNLETENEDNTTTVTFGIPANLNKGVVIFCLDIDGHGCSVLENSSTVPVSEVVLRVDGISPLQGSVFGGTVIYIDGFGFGYDKDVVEVTVQGYRCVINYVTDSQIACQIEETYYIKTITNTGVGDLNFGFAWNQDSINVYTMDTVTWQWDTQDFSDHFNYGVYQIETSDAFELLEGGINSGSPTASGNFSVKFTIPGTYYFWSGYIDEHKIIYSKGAVYVAHRESSVGEIVVLVSNQEATYSKGSGSVSGQSTIVSDTCPPVTPEIFGVPAPVLDFPNPDIYYFIFHDNITPAVTSVDFDPAVPDYDQGITVFTPITFTAVGIPAAAAQTCVIHVTLGRGNHACECEITGIRTDDLSGEVMFDCLPNANCAHSTGVLREIQIGLYNIGIVPVQVPYRRRFVAILPVITAIEPMSGSVEGGAVVIFEGAGFEEVNSFKFGTTDAVCNAISNTELKCIAPKSSSGLIDFQKDGFPVVCALNNGEICEFIYDPDLTPEIYTVSSSQSDSSEQIRVQITGEKFGSDLSDVKVIVGVYECPIISSSDTEIECLLDTIQAGINIVKVVIGRRGLAQPTKSMYGDPILYPPSPASGSVHGGTAIELTGHGFHSKDQTSVTIGGDICFLIEVQSTRLVCDTPPHAEGMVQVVISVGSVDNIVTFPEVSFHYSSDSTVDVDQVNPQKGIKGDHITIQGSGFGDDLSNVRVEIGESVCNILPNEFNGTSLKCTLSSHVSGQVVGFVHVRGLGRSNTFLFTYQLSVLGVEPNSGTTKGNQIVNIQGEGYFSDKITVTICETPCRLVADQSTQSQLVCLTLPSEEGICPVTVSDPTASFTLANAYTYSSSAVVPTITSVEPTRGGTGGGTLITVTGSGFGTNQEAVKITLDPDFASPDPAVAKTTLDGIPCDIVSLTDTEIRCVTNGASHSMETKVTVTVGTGRGVEENTGDAMFLYIDLWSSVYTWGGKTIPQAAEMVVIQENQVVLLDIDTPVLKMVLLKGGKLIFDETKETIEFNSEAFLITNGGELQIGTETKPYTKKAIITLHGHLRSAELPVYGAKCLAVREGSLNLHGLRKPKTWTLLSATANASSSQIRVPLPDIENWKVDDKIIIATTGGYLSQKETEEQTIKKIVSDGNEAIIELDKPLQYMHTGETEIFSGREVMMRGEVGLLSRNIIIRGSDDDQWHDEIPVCDEEMDDTGMFGTQTCFQGRFGEEPGSDQFGAHVIIHPKQDSLSKVVVKLEYVEITHVGQAFRLGRNPIKFHHCGDMGGSYVRGCAIHKSFNRAVSIHGTHNLQVESNVVYNIQGGAIFLEDGIETGNVLQQNALVFVRSSTSLLNVDIHPAAMWITNPNNTVRYNSAAGGTGTAFQYKFPEYPTGSSSENSDCPRSQPLKEFAFNTAHSNRFYGFWSWTYMPQANGKCTSNVNNAATATFQGLTTWNNKVGAEFGVGGALIMEDMVALQNSEANFREVRAELVPKRDHDIFNGLINCTIVGRTNADHLRQRSHGVNGVTERGVVVAFGNGVAIKHTVFVNIDENGTSALFWTDAKQTCSDECGGYPMLTFGVTFEHVLNKIDFRWLSEAIIEDSDNSLECLPETSSAKILPDLSIVPPDVCMSCAQSEPVTIKAIGCPSSIRFHNLAFNVTSPYSLRGKDVVISNQHGNLTGPYRTKRVRPFKPGYQVTLVDGEKYLIEFVGAEHIQNISVRAVITDFSESDCMTFAFKAQKKPDRFSFNYGRNIIPAKEDGLVECPSANHGDWTFDAENGYIIFAVAASDPNNLRRSTTGYPDDIFIALTMYKCWYDFCITPPPKDHIPPRVVRKEEYSFCDELEWHQDPENPSHFISRINVTEDTTESTPERRKRNTLSTSLIPEGSDVTVAKDHWVVVRTSDCLPHRMRTLLLLGVLEMSDLQADGAEASVEYTHTFDFIMIRGGRLIIGWPGNPFEGKVTLTLAGNIDSPYYHDENIRGPEFGSKAIGVNGGLDVHGKNYGETWTTLKQTVNKGDSVLRVLNDISLWPVGGTIIITTTSYLASETEKRTIASIIGMDTIVIDQPLSQRHIATKETVFGTDYGFSGSVALLSRNIKIRADEEESDSILGARILISVIQEKSTGDFFTGFGRFTNVEFENMGQEGFTDPYDARHAVTWYGTSVKDAKPSSMSGCAFNNIYSTAIGVYGSSGLQLHNNVIYNTVGNAVVIASSGVQFVQNLISNVRSTASYNGRQERYRTEFDAALKVKDGATGLTLTGNYITGSEGTAYSVPPTPYMTASAFDDSNTNIAVASLFGWAMFPRDSVRHTGVNHISGFKFWKILDYAVLYNNKNSLQISFCVFADNTVDVFPMIFGPSAVEHKCEYNTVKFTDSVMIGYTSSRDSTEDPSPDRDYMRLSRNCRGIRGPGGEKLGVIFPQLMSISNDAPIPGESCHGARSYMSLCGNMSISDVDFVNFGPFDDLPSAFVIATNPDNSNLQHPVATSNIRMQNVNSRFIVMIQRPPLEKIRPGVCVDMDCDGLKKVLLTDLDGTLLGHPGSILSDAGFEYNKNNSRRGFGDYRIPGLMQTRLDGSRIPFEQIRDRIGIAGTETCEYVRHVYPDSTDFANYQCENSNRYQMMVVESLDEDTEDRRLSPVAVRVNFNDTQYVDLLNGAEGHSWCEGYKCNKRLSTFFPIVPDEPGILVEIFLTGSTPDKMRFFFMTPDPDTCVLVSFFYSTPNRLDVYANSGIDRIYSTNTRVLENERVVLENDPDKDYNPTCDMGAGANHLLRDEKQLKFILKGTEMIVFAKAHVVIVSFWLPDMTYDEFYGDTIVINIAAMLNLPLNKVRIVKADRADGGGNRRKRESNTGMTIQVEIGDEPPPTADDQATEPQYKTADEIVLACQDSTIVEALGAGNVVCESVAIEEDVYMPTAPERLEFVTELVPEHEGVIFTKQPVLRAFDNFGNAIQDLGIKENPWQVTATLRNGTGHPRAILGGTTNISAIHGWFNFTDLAISHAGYDYVLDFEITYPPRAAALNLSVTSASFNVTSVPMTTGLYAMTSGEIFQDTEFSLTLDLRDKTTGQTIEDITWRDHTFGINCGLPDFTDISSVVTGNLSKTFDSFTGRTQFDKIALSDYGPIFLECHIISTPKEFDFYFYQKVLVRGTSQSDLNRDTSDTIGLRFKERLTTALPTDKRRAQLEYLVLQDIVKTNPYVVLVDSSITEGSILITFTVEGSPGNVSLLEQHLCDAITDRQSYTLGDTTLTLDYYMTVDGQEYYENMCGATVSDESGLEPGYIALIVIGAILLLILLILLILWKLHIIPKTKTHGVHQKYNCYTQNQPGIQRLHVEPLSFPKISDNGKPVFLGGVNSNVFRETTLDSMQGDGAPPLNTLYSSNVKLDLRRTPTPTGSVNTLFTEQNLSPTPPLPNEIDLVAPAEL